MIRKLLTTTAIVTMVATGAALAENQKTEVGATGGHAASIFENGPKARSAYAVDGYLKTMDGQILASSLLGKTVYSDKGVNAESIGDVNDVVMSRDGRAEAIVIGVGGFLGLGEKDVAVSFERARWTMRDGELQLSINATKEELESAPDFDRIAVVDVTAKKIQMTSGDGALTVSGNDDASAQPKNETDQVADNKAEDAPADMKKTPSESAAADGAGHQSDATETAKSETAASPTAEATAGDTATDDGKIAVAERDGMILVDRTTVSAENLIGTRVYGADDSDLGEIGDVILSTKGDLEAYVIDVGGFLGLGEKPVAFDAKKLDIFKDADGDLRIFTPFTEKELEKYPAYSEAAYKKDPDAVLVR